MVHIAVFASGAGTNARKILTYFEGSPEVQIGLIVTNRKDALVLRTAEEKGIPALLLDRSSFYDSKTILGVLGKHSIDLIVLAGFLWLIPAYLVKNYNRRIVNIHPALLPKHGGKGMYGHYVHEAVLEAGDKESGITIHLIDEHYDRGQILFQAKCPVEATDTPETLAQRVQQLEHLYYAQIIEQYIKEGNASALFKNQLS